MKMMTLYLVSSSFVYEILGVSCFSGYSISVQYEDDFLVGNSGTACCNPISCGANSRVRLRYRDEKAFELEYRPRVSCSSPKVQICMENSFNVVVIHYHALFSPFIIIHENE